MAGNEEAAAQDGRFRWTYPERVDHPRHYNQHAGGIECIDVVRHFRFNSGNIIKYVWRGETKSGAERLADLEKALWYLEDEIAALKAKVAP